MVTTLVLFVSLPQERPLARVRLHIFLAIKVPQVFLKAQVLQLRSVQVELKQAIDVNGRPQIAMVGVISIKRLILAN